MIHSLIVLGQFLRRIYKVKCLIVSGLLVSSSLSSLVLSVTCKILGSIRFTKGFTKEFKGEVLRAGFEGWF